MAAGPEMLDQLSSRRLSLYRGMHVLGGHPSQASTLMTHCTSFQTEPGPPVGFLGDTCPAFPLPEKFYKRRSQEKHPSLGRTFSCSPAPLIEQEWFWPSAPWTRFVAQPGRAVGVFSPSGFHRIFATRPVSSETRKQIGGQVPTMVLLGTRSP